MIHLENCSLSSLTLAILHIIISDNFFVKAERPKIVAGDFQSNTKTSFEDIGRILGQRWKNIKPEELAAYKEMAREDSDRYKEEMKAFYESELTFMSHHNFSNSSNQPSSVAAACGSFNYAAAQPRNEIGTHASAVVATNSTNRSGIGANMSATMDSQILQLVLQQQHQSSQYSREAIINLIQTQKLSMEQQMQKLTSELNTLQAKSAFYDTLLANERIKQAQVPSSQGQGNVPVPSVGASSLGMGSLGNPSAPAAALLLPGQVNAPDTGYSSLGGLGNNHSPMAQLLSLLQQQTASTSTNGLLGVLGGNSTPPTYQGQQQQESESGATNHPASSSSLLLNSLFQSTQNPPGTNGTQHQ